MLFSKLVVIIVVLLIRIISLMIVNVVVHEGQTYLYQVINKSLLQLFLLFLRMHECSQLVIMNTFLIAITFSLL